MSRTRKRPPPVPWRKEAKPERRRSIREYRHEAKLEVQRGEEPPKPPRTEGRRTW